MLPFQIPEDTLMARRKCSKVTFRLGIPKWFVVYVNEQRIGIMQLTLPVIDLCFFD